MNTELPIGLWDLFQGPIGPSAIQYCLAGLALEAKTRWGINHSIDLIAAGLKNTLETVAYLRDPANFEVQSK